MLVDYVFKEFMPISLNRFNLRVKFIFYFLKCKKDKL